MKKTLLISLFIVIVLAIVTSSVVIFYRLLHIETYKDDIIAAAQKTLKRQVTYERGDFSFRRGPAFTFAKVTVMEHDGTSVFISSDELSFKIALLPLLKKKLVLKEVFLERPKINLSRDKNGNFNFSDILEGKKQEIPLQVNSFRIKSGFASLSDQHVSQQGVIISLENLDLFISRPMRGKGFDIRLTAGIAEKGKKSVVSLNGKAILPSGGAPLLDTHLNMTITARNLDARHYWDYYSRYVPFRKISGQLDLDATYKGTLPDFSSSGTMKLTGLNFDYPQVFHNPLTPKNVQIEYDMELTPKDLSVKQLLLNVDGLIVKGSCALKDIYSDDLLIDAEAITNSFRVEDFGKYIPFGIIPHDTSEFIEQHIKGGTCRLQEGTLKGRISQIAHMEKGTNYNVLFIKGTVDKGIVSFGPAVPVFNGIRGNLMLRGKEFNLSGIDGFFGSSPFKLEGKITDYPLHTPSGYPFTMTMSPAPAEVAWLLDHKNKGKLAFAGQSALSLSGSGTSSNYSLNGSWDLTAAAYIYSDIIKKPSGQTNQVSFKGSINNKEEARVSSLHYTLNGLSLTAGGVYRFTGENQLAFSVNSNLFQIEDIVPMIPRLVKYQAKGKMKTAIRSKAATEAGGTLSTSGNVSLSGVSFNPPGGMKQLENINGSINFIDDSLQTPMLSARIGTSAFQGSGTMTGFKNPLLNFDFAVPVLHFSDFGLSSRTKTPVARKVRGNISFKDGNLKIRSLSGQINKSVVDISGTIEDISNPKLAVMITSPYLDLSDLMLLKGLETVKEKSAPPAIVSGQVSLQADSGKIDRFSFSKLKTVLQFQDKTVSFQPLDLSLLGGTISARGQADFSRAEKSRYQANFDIKDISAAQLMQSLQTTREVTGNISMQGEISAGGENFEEIRKTASGNIKFNCVDGSLRKFAVLSKIFSILNVSQLLKFQLPDMVSGGMPFNRITGTFALQNGVVATDNLFIDSNAMNISVIGMFDLPKEKLDLTVGVKPLQTVDKIVSHIPIVGWVLTGKNKSLVTAYFEAKGDWENPQVRAIPVKSLAKGVFNIFKRVFQLPAKLITDTGEVILAN